MEEDDVVRVKAGSSRKELVAIGHKNQSETFIPSVARSEATNFVFLDCPGFMDNRGAEVRGPVHCATRVLGH
jgi:hypothetical protein